MTSFTIFWLCMSVAGAVRLFFMWRTNRGMMPKHHEEKIPYIPYKAFFILFVGFVLWPFVLLADIAATLGLVDNGDGDDSE